MNKARIEYYLNEIESWEVSPPTFEEAQRTTKGLVNELFPNLRRDYINWLAGNFMAVHVSQDLTNQDKQI